MRFYKLVMKKIGIITFHASHNYGSVLQAYALQKKLTVEGYDVKIINYRTDVQKACYPLKQKYTGAKGMLRTLWQKAIFKKLKRRYYGFEQFINEILPTTKEVKNQEELKQYATAFDVYVCGSDQIWNPACQDFSPAYYLNFVEGKRTVAYAPSLGKAEFEKKDEALIASLLKNVDYVSVREKKGADLLEKLTDKPVENVCDPVILLDKKYWDEVAVKPDIKQPYLLCYFLDNNHGNYGYLELIAKTLNLKIVVLNERIRDFFKLGYRKEYGALPFEFVGLIKYASFVYTNSFHATAFSTIFNVPFASMVAEKEGVHNNNDSRKIDFLNAVGLSENVKKVLSAEEIVALSKTNFSEANICLEKLRDKSHTYLIGAVDND